MNKKWISFLILTILLGIASGCASKKELNDMGIALAMGVDKKGEQYLVSIQIVNPGAISSQGSSSNRSPVTTYSTTGKTIFEAIRRLTKETPRKIYFAHLRMLIISEALAREQGISNILEFLMRDPELRKDFYVLIARGVTARTVLSITTPIEKIPANKIFRSLEMSHKYWAPTTAVPMNKLVLAIAREGKEPVLTGVSIKGSAQGGVDAGNAEKVRPDAVLRLSGIAVFKKDRLIGWLDEHESKGYNYMTNEVTSTVGSIACGKNQRMNVEVVRTDTNMKAEVQNGRPVIRVRVKVKGNVAEVGCPIDMMRNETVAMVQQKFNERVKYMMKMALAKAKREHADIFGFGDLLYRTHAEEWQKLRKDWNDRGFLQTRVHFQVETQIKHTGITIESPLKHAQ